MGCKLQVASCRRIWIAVINRGLQYGLTADRQAFKLGKILIIAVFMNTIIGFCYVLFIITEYRLYFYNYFKSTDFCVNKKTGGGV